MQQLRFDPELPPIPAASVPTHKPGRAGEWRLIDDDPLHRGPRQWFRWDGRSKLIEIKYEDEIEGELESNKAMATHNDGYSPSRGIRRVASIPASVQLKWLLEEGWDCLAAENRRKLRRRLNDPEWMWLRTAPGRL